VYRLRPARLDDISSLLALRGEVENWLTSIGEEQWRDPTTREKAITTWKKQIENGLTWVIETTNYATLVGTVSRDGPDRDFWHPEDKLETGFYLYKLIVSRSTAGQRLGSRVLDWASRVAASEGRGWVRIDCWRTNTRLQQYYLNLGFEHVRTEAPAHRKSGWLAQRPAGTTLEKPEIQLDILSSAAAKG
jgi:ribosomal protein S18 acetylase RimI-like enzyme